MATTPRERRVYATRDPELELVLEDAPAADLVADDAPLSDRLRAWALYGHRAWQEQARQAAKMAAYAQIAAETGREKALDRHLAQAVEAGIF